MVRLLDWPNSEHMKIVDAANGLSHPYTPHLLMRTVALAPGKEWSPQSSGWTLIQIESGTGYWLCRQARAELETGTVILFAGDVPGRVLASCLNGMVLRFYTVIPERLCGLITQGEQDFLKRASGRKEFACQVVPPTSPVAVKMRSIIDNQNQASLLFRLSLLQLLVELIGKDLEQPVSHHAHTDVKERLQLFLLETPPAALLEISIEELAQMTHCTPRHLSRVFYDVVGMSFRDKRAEIRLGRARELLATSESKVVDVALKSGYKSLSLFNRMFTRRFGLSPGKWRQKNGGKKDAIVKARVLVNQSRFRMS